METRLTHQERYVRYFYDAGIKSHTIAYIMELTVNEVDTILDKYERTLSAIERDYFANEWPKVKTGITQPKKTSPGTVTEEQIVRAKDYPIINLLSFTHGKRKCIWHEEKTASLSLKGNKVHCFGCDKTGDAIDVYQTLNNCSFTHAVQSLQ